MSKISSLNIFVPATPKHIFDIFFIPRRKKKPETLGLQALPGICSVTPRNTTYGTAKCNITEIRAFHIVEILRYAKEQNAVCPFSAP